MRKNKGMNTNTDNYRLKKIIWGFMIIHAILYFSLDFVGSPLHTSTDEVGAIVGASVLAGLDWSGVINNSGYYGFGWYSLFFWLFNLTDNPFIIYPVIKIITSLLRIAIIPISYYYLSRLLKNNQKDSLLLCFLSPLLCFSGLGKISNDVVLETLFWVMLLLLCLMLKTDKKRKEILYALLLSLTCIYSLTIHTRALVPYIAICVFLFFTAFILKRYLQLFIVCLLIVSEKGMAYLISAYQSSIWSNTGDELRNASVEVKAPIDFFDPLTWKVWINMFFGMLSSEQILTAGVFVIAIAVIIVFFIEFLLHKTEQDIVVHVVLFVIPILCIGAVFLSLMFSGWATSMYDVWGKKDEKPYYAFKSLCNVRYWAVFASPLMLAALSWLMNNYSKKKEIFKLIWVILIFNISFFTWSIIPLVYKNSDVASLYTGITGYLRGDELTKNMFYSIVLISFFVCTIIYYLLYRGKKTLAILLVASFFVFKLVNKTFGYDLNIREQLYASINSSYEMKQRLEKEGISIENIYISDDPKKDNNWKIYAAVQFYMNRYKVSDYVPEVINTSDIIISTYRNDEILSEFSGITEMKLDDNEYWYTFLQL